MVTLSWNQSIYFENKQSLKWSGWKKNAHKHQNKFEICLISAYINKITYSYL